MAELKGVGYPMVAVAKKDYGGRKFTVYFVAPLTDGSGYVVVTAGRGLAVKGRSRRWPGVYPTEGQAVQDIERRGKELDLFLIRSQKWVKWEN